jgi:hypothetical protein
MIYPDQLNVKKAIKRVGPSRKLPLSVYRPPSIIYDKDERDVLKEKLEEMQGEEEEDYARMEVLRKTLKSLSKANIMLRESVVELQQGLVIAEHTNRCLVVGINQPITPRSKN